MKNVLLSICCFFLLTACQQTNIDVWEDDGNIALHFVQTAEEATGISRSYGEHVVTGNDPVYGSWVRDYWWQKSIEDPEYGWEWNMNSFIYMDNQYVPIYAFGDSSTHVTDTLPLVVTYSGTLQENGFFYSLRQQAVEDYEMSPMDFLWDTVQNGKNRFFFEGGAVYDTVRIVLKKPETFGEFRFNVVVDSIDNVVHGITENRLQLYIVKNEYALDQGVTWNEDVLGEYSQEKYAFFQTVTHLRYTSNLEMLFTQDWNRGFVKRNIHTPLVETLEEYNAANPDNPKPFTFPPYEE